MRHLERQKGVYLEQLRWWSVYCLSAACLALITLPDPLSALKVTLGITLAGVTIIVARPQARKFIVGVSIAGYALSVVFQVKVEGRYAPLGIDPNYEAIFFLCLLATAIKNRKIFFILGVGVALLSQSLTALAAISLAVIVKKRLVSMLLLFLLIYPGMLNTFEEQQVSEAIGEMLSSAGISDSKVTSMRNRIASQYDHLQLMPIENIAGYGRAELVGLTLGAHNTWVQMFAQQGLLLFLLHATAIMKIFKRIDPINTTLLAVASFMLDIFSFPWFLVSVAYAKIPKDRCASNP